MNALSSILKKMAVGIVILVIPLWLSLSAVRLLLTDAYLSFEYNRVDFPADPFGMSKNERLEYAPLAIDYLVNNEPVSFLRDLRFPDGSAQYNDRELRHMADVQFVVRGVVVFHNVLTIALLAFAGWVVRSMTTRKLLRTTLRNGAFLTLLIIFGLITYAALSWDYFFTQFHQVFFESGTWRFEYSDTLIRLFPEQFWFDAALTVGILTTLGALTLILITWLWGKKLKPAV